MEVSGELLSVELIAAYILAFLAALVFVYSAVELLLPGVRARMRADEAEIDAKLQDLFYTDSQARTFLFIKYGGALVALVVGVLLLDSLVFGLFLAVLVFLLPGFMLDNIVRRRRERLAEQTGDVMTAFSACIKGGMTIEQSIDEIVDTMRPPIAEEFALIRERIEAGQPVIAAVRSANQRLDVPRLSLIFQTITISLERGGRLATLMDRLAESTREIERVEERVKTETSGLRLSARIMAVMPLVLGIMLYTADPKMITLLFDTIAGNIILVIAIALDISAYMIMKKLIDLDV
ncbi:MAG: type II secretion system F family protein [Gammaproteobacteria bacterium]|jgi:tight adherence protein B|nr:type II secretion system F family protein [Gammaproteobacteria bacterium]